MEIVLPVLGCDYYCDLPSESNYFHGGLSLSAKKSLMESPPDIYVAYGDDGLQCNEWTGTKALAILARTAQHSAPPFLLRRLYFLLC